jgi:hypothetical protein
MSMHQKPLTRLEEAGLLAHGLDIGTPSQLSDAFRQGVAWSQGQQIPRCTAARPDGWAELFKAVAALDQHPKGSGHALPTPSTTRLEAAVIRAARQLISNSRLVKY